MIESNLEEDELDEDVAERLNQQRCVKSCTRVVENPMMDTISMINLLI